MGFPKGRGAALPCGRPTGFIPGGEIKLIQAIPRLLLRRTNLGYHALN